MPPTARSRAELQGRILVPLLQTLAAASAEFAVYHMVLEPLFPHVRHSGASGRGMARPGRAWR